MAARGGQNSWHRNFDPIGETPSKGFCCSVFSWNGHIYNQTPSKSTYPLNSSWIHRSSKEG